MFVLLSATIIGSDEANNSLAPFNPSNALQDNKGLLLGAIFGILAFIGFEAASALGEEARDPRRTVPRGVLYSCIGIGLYYVFCCYAWVVGTPDIVQFHADTEGNDWIQFAHDHWGAAWWIVFIALVNSNLACAAAAVNNAARVLFAMGRAGSLPSILGRVHNHHRTPYVAVITVLGLSSISTYLAGEKLGPGARLLHRRRHVHDPRDRDLHAVVRRLHRVLHPQGGGHAAQELCCCTSCARCSGSSSSCSPCTRSTSASTRRSSRPSPSSR